MKLQNNRIERTIRHLIDTSGLRRARNAEDARATAIAVAAVREILG
ncbi:hypothetical protein [Sphingomonas sp. MS122]